MALETVGTPLLWGGFTLVVLGLLTLDLYVFHRKAHEVRIKEAATWSVVWVALALLFNAGVFIWFGRQKGLEFLTGYLIEKALSVDNIFVFLVIFSYFAVPAKLQHRVLFWGVLGALLSRALFIVLGATLLQRFHWVIYIFGGLLLFTGAKLLFQREGELHPERNPLFRLFHRLVRTVPDFRGSRFVVIEQGKLYATPLLLVLVAIEATDIVFAIDSVPAIFAITTDPFIVYTSNIFAILGLRALYFVIAGAMGRFHYLNVGLALVLAFVGAKMLLTDLYKVPIVVSLGVIVTLIIGSMVISLVRRPTRPSLSQRPSQAIPPGAGAAGQADP